MCFSTGLESISHFTALAIRAGDRKDLGIKMINEELKGKWSTLEGNRRPYDGGEQPKQTSWPDMELWTDLVWWPDESDHHTKDITPKMWHCSWLTIEPDLHLQVIVLVWVFAKWDATSVVCNKDITSYILLYWRFFQYIVHHLWLYCMCIPGVGSPRWGSVIQPFDPVGPNSGVFHTSPEHSLLCGLNPGTRANSWDSYSSKLLWAEADRSGSRKVATASKSTPSSIEHNFCFLWEKGTSFGNAK